MGIKNLHFAVPLRPDDPTQPLDQDAFARLSGMDPDRGLVSGARLGLGIRNQEIWITTVHIRSPICVGIFESGYFDLNGLFFGSVFEVVAIGGDTATGLSSPSEKAEFIIIISTGIIKAAVDLDGQQRIGRREGIVDNIPLSG